MSETPTATYRFENYIWFSASSALMLAGPFCVILILSRMQSPLELGLYAYAYAVTAPVQAFAGLHARAFIAMDRLFGYRIEDVLAQRAYLGALQLLAVLVVTMIRGAGSHDVWVFLGVAIARIAEGLTDVSAGQLQRLHRPRLIALVYAVRGVVGLGTFAALLAAQWPLGAALSGMGTANLLAFLVVDRALLASIGAAPNLRLAGFSLATSRPLVLGLRLLPGALLAALSVVEVNLPRYVVEAFRGIAAVGVYTTLGVLLNVATNVVHPVFFMTFARLGQTAQHRDPESSKYLMRMILTNTALTVGGSSVLVAFCIGFGPSLLITVFGPEWARFHELFGVLAVGAGASLLRSCLGFILTGLNVFAPQIVITLMSGVVFLALAVLFDGRTDIFGVGLAWASASLIAVGANAVVLGAALRRHRLAAGVPPLAAGAHLGV
jgi:O-antigen/teichoic acid export membrane protein